MHSEKKERKVIKVHGKTHWHWSCIWTHTHIHPHRANLFGQGQSKSGGSFFHLCESQIGDALQSSEGLVHFGYKSAILTYQCTDEMKRLPSYPTSFIFEPKKKKNWSILRFIHWDL